MLTWIIVFAAVIGILLITQLNHFKHKFGVIILILFLLFLSLSFMNVINDNSVDLSSTSGFFSAFKLYFSWLGHVFDNMKVITGNAVRMNWAGNSSG